MPPDLSMLTPDTATLLAAIAAVAVVMLGVKAHLYAHDRLMRLLGKK